MRGIIPALFILPYTLQLNEWVQVRIMHDMRLSGLCSSKMGKAQVQNLSLKVKNAFGVPSFTE